MEIEIKAGVKYIFAEQAVFPRLVNSYLQALDCDGVLRADIDIALGSAGGVAADGHCLDDAVRVALKHGTIHECAGVALVGVTDDILLIRCVRRGEAPLEAGRESAAASASEAGILDLLDDLLGGHLGQHLAQSGIAVHCDIFVDILGVYEAAVTQRNSLLSLIEVGVVE